MARNVSHGIFSSNVLANKIVCWLNVVGSEGWSPLNQSERSNFKGLNGSKNRATRFRLRYVPLLVVISVKEKVSSVFLHRQATKIYIFCCITFVTPIIAVLLPSQGPFVVTDIIYFKILKLEISMLNP